MTVQELIEKLKELPQDMEVVVPSSLKDYRFYAVEGANEFELQPDLGPTKKIICLSQLPDNYRWELVHSGKVNNYWKRETVWALCEQFGIAYNEEMDYMSIPEITRFLATRIKEPIG